MSTWNSTTKQISLAKEIEELKAMLATILSRPAVRDIEESIAKNQPGASNPITDARKMVKK